MRNRIPAWANKKSDISKNRYAELKSFCLQYQERTKIATSLLGPHGCSFTMVQSGGTVSDPTFRAVEKREKLLQENALIDQCLNGVAGGAWAAALKQNVCQGVALHHIEPRYMPSSNRNAFFSARKAFFLMLDDLR